jgi:metal-responsive CopG/Arc/MetJ family transcriptional regulator
MKRDTDPPKTFTTTLPDALLRELDRAAKELGVRKNEIIAQALTSWIKSYNQALLAESHTGGKKR